jgi:hypothetical protein
MNKLPLARTKDLVLQDLGNEILIYDLKINKAYCLNETSAIIFQNCDGKTSFDELSAKANLTDEVIFYALDQLQKDNLIEGEEILFFKGLTRREVIRRVGLASVIALPVVAGIIAPTAAHAQSGCSRFEGGGSPGTTEEAIVDTAVQPFTDCYTLAAAKCASCSFTEGSGGAVGGTLFHCTVVCA